MQFEDKSLHNWKLLNKVGLFPSVKSLEDYENKVLQGTILAADEHRKNPCLSPTLEVMRETHYVIFKDVHPWAGNFRGHGQEVWFGGITACDYQRIPIELEMLHHQTKALLNDSKTVNDQALALAFSHGRFERIHPFHDGNGRTGRVLLDSQINAVWGVQPSQNPIHRQEYLSALGHLGRDFTPLMNIVLKRADLPEAPAIQRKPPYRFVPQMTELDARLNPIILSLEDEIRKSRIPGIVDQAPGSKPVPTLTKLQQRLQKKTQGMDLSSPERDIEPEIE